MARSAVEHGVPMPLEVSADGIGGGDGSRTDVPPLRVIVAAFSNSSRIRRLTVHVDR
ncbi:MAG: hypothetical protein ACRDGJ_09750 [Candidatus Limnocylindria bacterium]